MLATNGLGLDGRQVTVSGSGNVAIYAIKKVQALGGRVVACSDSSGYVFDRTGIDVELQSQLKEVERKGISEYAERRGAVAPYAPGKPVWEVPCEVALPCATQNELDTSAAKQLIESGVVAVARRANMPCTPEAVRLLREAGALFGPGKAANAGGRSDQRPRNAAERLARLLDIRIQRAASARNHA